MNKHKGFTIVELLIVIVVIGILAAISLVAYNGIQNRASAAKKTSLVNSFLRKSEVYRVNRDTYPLIDSQSMNATQINARFSEMELGAITENIVAGPLQLLESSSPCRQPPMTKQKMCVYSRDTDGYKAIVYWEDDKSQWKLKYILPGQQDQEYIVGNGDFPNAEIYD